MFPWFLSCLWAFSEFNALGHQITYCIMQNECVMLRLHYLHYMFFPANRPPCRYISFYAKLNITQWKSALPRPLNHPGGQSYLFWFQWRDLISYGLTLLFSWYVNPEKNTIWVKHCWNVPGNLRQSKWQATKIMSWTQTLLLIKGIVFQLSEILRWPPHRHILIMKAFLLFTTILWLYLYSLLLYTESALHIEGLSHLTWEY